MLIVCFKNREMYLIPKVYYKMINKFGNKRWLMNDSYTIFYYYDDMIV